ncbi:E3 ubiquitin-protein ligase RNF19A isoform X2 [Dunckerocampus dactyliophorus]|uniref:E3 ubiquitin-protein ligase RNF19A isoform X2 n=1 Tax=Dunckerocampus dactyliophorus TaxID=161453 RepID=UPI00240696E3|nr:E3 ubiquitin-protein ligase RNF19A isoform X2 [Dunckerocampus dactyliophorus]
MKRPKQQQTGPLSFLNFFSRKPKSEPRPEKNVEARPKEEVAITLTLREHPELELATEDAAESSVSGAERSEGGGTEPADDAGAAAAAPSCGSTDVLSLSSSSQDHLVDEHLEECPLCLLSQPRCRFPRLITCSHRTCSDCLRQYLRIEISESRVGIACPQCPETLAPLDVRTILDDRALLERFEEYHLRRFLAADPDTRWCPAPDCSYAVIAYGCAECPKLSCGRDGCNTEFCYHCRQLWHPNQTCDQARRQRARHGSASKDASALYVFNEEAGGDAEEIKPCPRCGAYIMKTNDGSCNRMNCTVCACQFCWLCMQEITDVHYLSPSGCTFWGKKPWSQTRKVLWQVGMLLGAPVVISLIAGIAIPVIIVGIPIYMGRKVHGRCKKNNISGSKHYLTVASGVMMSVFVSPVIAAVTVGTAGVDRTASPPTRARYNWRTWPATFCSLTWSATTGRPRATPCRATPPASTRSACRKPAPSRAPAPRPHRWTATPPRRRNRANTTHTPTRTASQSAHKRRFRRGMEPTSRSAWKSRPTPEARASPALVASCPAVACQPSLCRHSRQRRRDVRAERRQEEKKGAFSLKHTTYDAQGLYIGI